MALDEEKLYEIWSEKINHFQTTRHAFLALHISTVGWLANEAIKADAIFTRGGPYDSAWVLLTSVVLLIYCGIEANHFNRIIHLSGLLMNIEIRSENIGYAYYSKRKGKGRLFFYILGVCPEVITICYLVMIFILLNTGCRCMHLNSLIISAVSICITVFVAILNTMRYAKMLNEKDEQDI